MIQTKFYPVTEDAYDFALEVMPPIYVSQLIVNGEHKGIRGFAVSEPMTYSNGTVVCSVYFQEGDEYYKAIAEIRTHEGGPVDETYGHYYGRGYIATAVQVNEDSDNYLFKEYQKLAA